MSYIRMVNEDEATGQVAEDYAYLSASYSKLFGAELPTPNVYRTPSLVGSYFNFGAVQNRVATNDGKHDVAEQGPIPGLLVNFGVALYSSCYY